MAVSNPDVTGHAPSVGSRGRLTEISDDLITQCMHCGLCLSVCPTYALTGLERSSPRGRIRLMKSVQDGIIPVSGTFEYEMNFCLDCQACQTACPAGVKYGELVESARVLIESRRKGFSLKKFILTNFVAGKKGLRVAAAVLRFYQKSGAEKILLPVLKVLMPGLYKRAGMLPCMSDKFAIDVLPEMLDPKGEARGTVAILTGCVMDAMYSDVNIDTVEVLLENRWRIATPTGQVCCGSVSAHSGDIELAKSLAVRNIRDFEKTGADYYVVNSAGCSAFMKEYGELLKEDPQNCARAVEFSARVKDFSEFLYETGYRKPTTKLGGVVTYHEPCHLVHAQKVSGQPRAIVNEISGENYRELNEATWCCGSAGIYNVVHYEEASKLLERKVENIRACGAGTLVTGNPGCMAQITAGVKNARMDVEVVHPATALNRLYKSDRKT